MVVRERAIAFGGRPNEADGLLPSEAAEAVPTAALSDDEYTLLDRYIARRASLNATRRAELAERLAQRFRAACPSSTAPTPRCWCDFTSSSARHAHEARRAGVVEAPPRAACDRGEGHAAVARVCGIADVGPASRVGHDVRTEVSDFVSRYRELAGDLARLQTAAGGRESDSLFVLSRLVAGGHSLLYRGRSVSWRSAWDYMTIAVPGESVGPGYRSAWRRR